MAEAKKEDAKKEEVKIGEVDDYFAKIGVVALKLTGNLSVGNTIHIKGHTTDLTQTVDSIPTERPERIVVAVPVFIESMISCTGFFV